MPTQRVGDVDLHYVEQGSGRPVLLVHGFPLDHTMWRGQIDRFAQHARVIAPDLRGFGRSSATPGTVTMERYADDLAGLLDALDVREPIALCGLSMGGYIAWQFWKRHRERLAKLILCDTRAAADTKEAAEGRRQTADKVERDGVDAVAASMMEKLFAPATVANRPQAVEEIRRVMLGASRDGVAAALRGMADRPDMTGELPQIAVPALVLCGEHDVITKVDEMRQVTASLPNARFVLVPDAGHMAPWEKPDEVNDECVRFLADGG